MIIVPFYTLLGKNFGVDLVKIPLYCNSLILLLCNNMEVVKYDSNVATTCKQII